MDGDKINVNVLPNEILVSIFRMLPASEFVSSVPFVCKRWMELIAADKLTLKRIGMHHSNSNGTVKFFYFDNEFCDNNFFTSHSRFFDCLLSNKGLPVSVKYSKAFYWCTIYPEFFEYIKVLVITTNLKIYETQGFTHLNPLSLTTLVLYETKMFLMQQSVLTELADIYPNIENVLLVKCFMSNQIAFEHLHSGFKNLKRFRFDHYTVNHNSLRDLLRTHLGIKTIYFGSCLPMGDIWIDVLMAELKGRTIQDLSMSSPYVSESAINNILTSGLILDHSKVKINKVENPVPFYITIV